LNSTPLADYLEQLRAMLQDIHQQLSIGER